MALRYRTAAFLTSGAIALILATSATTAYATKTLITGEDIARGTITGANIATGSIYGSDIKDKSITAADLAPGSINLKHLDTSSIKAGHVHVAGGVPRINPRTNSGLVGPAEARLTPTSTSSMVNFSWGQMTTLAQISNLPAGTYVVQVSGLVSAAAVRTTYTSYATSILQCQIGSGSNWFFYLDFSPGPVVQQSSWKTPIVITRVVTTTATANLTVQCMVHNASGDPQASGEADLVALPVTSVSAG